MELNQQLKTIKYISEDTRTNIELFIVNTDLSESERTKLINLFIQAEENVINLIRN